MELSSWSINDSSARFMGTHVNKNLLIAHIIPYTRLNRALHCKVAPASEQTLQICFLLQEAGVYIYLSFIKCAFHIVSKLIDRACKSTMRMEYLVNCSTTNTQVLDNCLALVRVICKSIIVTDLQFFHPRPS